MSLACECRYEILPFRRSEEQAAEVATPLRLTLTASAKHGIDRSVDYAERLRALGHRVTLHLAARMVRDRGHLDAILARTNAAGIDDLFVVGGDVPEPIGPYTSAGELLDVLAGHPLRPPAVGIAAYPEGHPLIGDRQLDAALEHKAPLASYMVTQICFDPDVLFAWLAQRRANGVALPLYAGATGQVDRRRLLEVSVRVGVGPSLRFLRKQRGVSRLLRGSGDASDRFQDAVEARLGDPELGIAGFHLFTFNELVATWRRQQERCAGDGRPAAEAGAT
jgi:methylenetetrahydrofolate reductase (NADPH)